jgi:putative transposase
MPRPNVLVRTSQELIECKFCGSTNVVKFGTREGVQRFWCKDCERKFVDNKALPGFRTPVEWIGLALDSYYEGRSLNSVCRQLEETYGETRADSLVYRWVTQFSQIAIREADQYKAHTGNTWVADETVLRIEGRNLWFWDVIDDETRFLLASHISSTRTTRDASALMNGARERSVDLPNFVMTDKLNVYIKGIAESLGAEPIHLQSQGFARGFNTNLIERFHGTIKARTKVMRGMKHVQTAKLIMNGWLVHYNFFRPHQSLRGMTPAQKARVRFPYQSWTDIVRSTPTE